MIKENIIELYLRGKGTVLEIVKGNDTPEYHLNNVIYMKVSLRWKPCALSNTPINITDVP